jgi:uncharacterized protein
MKRIAWVILGWLALLSIAQAASFDCSKAATTVEKLICGDTEISKLDDELSLVYKSALQNETLAATIRLTQKQWIKGRNHCQELACLKTSYQTRIRELSDLQVQSTALLSTDQTRFGSSNISKTNSIETTIQKLPLTYSLDQQVCIEAAAMLRNDKACRPYDSSCLPVSEDPSAEVNSININGKPTLTFKEIASNEYGYTRVFRTNADELEGYAVIYLEQFNGDNFPRTIETWKINAEALNKVFELPPGPIPYEKGGKGKRKQKASQPKDTGAAEFAALLMKSEKLSDDWSPVVVIQGGRYIAERKCAGEWEYGGIYACKNLIQLTLKKISASKEAMIYCQFSSATNK